MTASGAVLEGLLTLESSLMDVFEVGIAVYHIHRGVRIRGEVGGHVCRPRTVLSPGNLFWQVRQPTSLGRGYY